MKTTFGDSSPPNIDYVSRCDPRCNTSSVLCAIRYAYSISWAKVSRFIVESLHLSLVQ